MQLFNLYAYETFLAIFSVLEEVVNYFWAFKQALQFVLKIWLVCRIG